MTDTEMLAEAQCVFDALTTARQELRDGTGSSRKMEIAEDATTLFLGSHGHALLSLARSALERPGESVDTAEMRHRARNASGMPDGPVGERMLAAADTIDALRDTIKLGDAGLMLLLASALVDDKGTCHIHASHLRSVCMSIESRKKDRDSLRQQLEECRAAGFVDEKGQVRKVLGMLPITKDGCIYGHHSRYDKPLYGITTAGKVVEAAVRAIPIGDSSFRPEECYSTREAALKTQPPGQE